MEAERIAEFPMTHLDRRSRKRPRLCWDTAPQTLSISMDWLHEVFIIYIVLAQHYRMLVSSFFPYELGKDKAYISETVFTSIFVLFVLASQFLRIITFYSTQLLVQTTIVARIQTLLLLPPPHSAFEVLLIN
ncbi:Phosphatidylinositol:ceramide inositolphosphotransferase [Bienertia sinuspersici]